MRIACKYRKRRARDNAAMLRLIGIVISIGLADSLNPTTLAPALVLATGEHGRRDTLRFTAGVFGVYLLGGLVIALGPGELVLGLVPRPSHQAGQILEVIAGAVLLVAAAVLWRHRAVLAEKQLLSLNRASRSSLLLGMTITLLELPTAFPYFGAIAAVVGSNVSIPRQVILLALYNVCFVAPMLGIWATLALAGDQAQVHLERARGLMQRHWPLVLALVALVAGAFVITLGATGIAAHIDGHFGVIARKLHKLIPN
ncbi:MAG: GAP family protein [Solirubrobacteraceae bacterium]